MKKFYLAITSLLIAAGLLLGLSAGNNPVSAATDDGTFKVGMECGYAPFNWTQQTNAHGAVRIQGTKLWANGYDVQTAKIIAKKLGKKLVVVKTKWDGLLPSLTSGKIDAIIAGMSPTPDRRKSIDFTNVYYKSKLTVVVNRNSKYANANSLKDFKGAKLTAQLSTYHYDAIKQIKGVLRQPAMDDFPAMRVALESNTIDGYVSEIPEGITAEAANPDLKMIHFKKGQGFKTSASDTDLAIGVRKGYAETNKINSILAGMSSKQRDARMDDAVANQPSTAAKGNWFINILKDYGPMLLSGTGMTLLISLIGTIVGFIIGMLVGIIRTIPAPKKAGRRGLLGLCKWLLSVYIEVFRGTPMIVQAAVFYYGAAQAFGINMDRTVAALIIVSINTGAYISEIIRGGIISVDAGQFEAANALGMTHWQTMIKVILPQAVRNSLPAVTNEFIVNIKDTSVLSIISVSELFFTSETIAGQNFQFFHTYLVVCLIYLILTFTISRLFRLIEKHLDGPKNYNVMNNQMQVETPKNN
ncbi:ABC transporter permease subunit [Lacticaseibacillus sharpeae]|uniref:Amino acid ABC transporter periplasmic protein n=1 Tax=Lacticaseibacillus sharpeae JCM 1186 = DSM 20505 TaxID=1291052 RepID=A0A0R1ZN49_9LACO|nr:ABC transporter permease subunit [Lacticaseibacillus sharpeae]KRM54548.1 amino acid ABC transporter periplasmic protein [Lacticaseibacillus sharpeae JCM 1186 = DSM 20505]